MDCRSVRAQLALGERTAEIEAHMSTCPGCGGYAQRQQQLDAALAPELMFSAPPDLALRLLLLVPGAAPLRVPPKRWYVQLVYALTVVAVAVSLAVAVQLYGMLAAQVGLPEAVLALRSAPAAGLAWLYEALPQSRAIVPQLLALRDQMHWVLLALLAWAALDRSFARQTATS